MTFVFYSIIFHAAKRIGMFTMEKMQEWINKIIYYKQRQKELGFKKLEKP